jgi:small subunit ribosomal protein S2
MSESQTTQSMFEAGVHLGYSKTRRHPSAMPFVFTTKTRGDVIDLEKTEEQLKEAQEFMKGLAASGKMVLFVGTKAEARQAIRAAAAKLDMPFIDKRWVGGTMTNFKEINRRVQRLMDLQYKSEHNELVYRTKKEKLMLEREMEKLEKNFGGLTLLKQLPAALVIVDNGHEDIASEEALKLDIPVISISNTDCDINNITYPIVANDASMTSIAFLIQSLTEAYESGK